MEHQPEKLFKFFIPETCEDILSHSVPALLNKEHLRTSSETLHTIRFKGALSLWESFPDEVLNFFADQRPNIPTDVLSFRAKSAYNLPKLHDEHVYCGDELSVSGRFTQNVLHPVTTVAPLLHINARLGDFKICREAHPGGGPQKSSKGKQTLKKGEEREKIIAVDEADVVKIASGRDPARLVPDFAAVSPKDHSLRFIGEAKTPWNHRVATYITAYQDGRKRQMEQAFGQVAQYMYIFKLKYGFFTTYDETVFLKQVPRDGGWKLCFSRIITHEEGATPGGPPILSGDKKNVSISLRKCMLYLCSITEKDYLVENTTPFEEWFDVGGKTESQMVSPEQMAQKHVSSLTNDMARMRMPAGDPQRHRAYSPGPYTTPTRQPRSTEGQPQRQRSREPQPSLNPRTPSDFPTRERVRPSRETQPSLNPRAPSDSDTRESIVITVDKNGRDGEFTFNGQQRYIKLSDVHEDRNGQHYILISQRRYPVILRRSRR